MGIFESAKLLGKLIKESDTVKNFDAAKAAYESDMHIKALLDEFRVVQEAITTEVGKDEKDKDEAAVGKLNDRMNAIYEEITGSDVFANLEKMQNEVNNLMQQVNSTITFEVTGETPCSHDCSSCGGCH